MSKKFKNFEEAMNCLSEGIDCDAFIIPNPIAKVRAGEHHFYGDDKLYTMGNELLLTNEMQMSDNLELVQLWFVSKSAGFPCDNIADHALTAMCEDGSTLSARPLIDRWPTQIFVDCREGDIVNVRVPFYVRSDYIRNLPDDGPAWLRRGFTFEVSMRVRLNQSDYRYRTFGKFESVLARLTGDPSWLDEPTVSTVGTEDEPIPGSLIIDGSTKVTEDGRVSLRGKSHGINGDWESDNLFRTGMLVSEHGRRTYWKLGVRDLSLDVFNGIEEGGHLRISLPVVRKRGNEEIEHRDLWFDFRVSQYSCKDRNIGRVLQGVQKEMEGN